LSGAGIVETRRGNRIDDIDRRQGRRPCIDQTTQPSKLLLSIS
jgi:hypothetical protein